MELRFFQEEEGRGTKEPYAGVSFIEWREKIGEVLVQSELYILLHQQKGQWVDTRSDKFWAKYQKLKATTERLHIKTGSSIPTNKQLMIKAAGGSDKDHVYNFCSQSATITTERWGGSSSSSSVSSISLASTNDAYKEREKRLWGYM
ncbi:hypothetical protein M9H77_07446 [Catharanthus roseus]|uniref:Uncharacterized protein n=1 Tax=Catharanthus roseus TaxID=4058 RepID=A0ACC0BV82_CATRO|nr:hypothetical protein M9H77_07446 [Catharanthus roseus]